MLFRSSAWSGALLFSLLRSDQTGRLLGTGTEGQLDTLNDLRDVLFAYVSYADGVKAAGAVFAMNLSAVGLGNVNASIQLGRDTQVSGETLMAYYRSTRDMNALISTVMQGASYVTERNA